jgi:HNH endonuclease
MTEENFWKRVDKNSEDGCWRWLASTQHQGYGVVAIWNHGKRIKKMAHRLAYEFVKGPIPKGLTIDHLCRVPSCVNPAHLEAVSNRENVLRGVGLTAQNARKTHCKRGHELTPENTYTPSNRPTERWCRICQRAKNTRWRRSRGIPERKSGAALASWRRMNGE